ncbi:MAG: hypothetical protein RDV48_19140 [Candidatus Eremiobacteraeota bacterium]|nr:hypothetical protein [Candidatus Eremiobacteraeota bacterium]
MGIFSFISNFSHHQEILESKDEIMMGEIITAMTEMGYPVIGIMSNSDFQQIRFKTVGDEVLYSIIITLDRKTGGLASKVVGNIATLTFQAEVKNFLADPDDLIHMFSTDIKNILKIPLLGDIKINHELNSIFATKKNVIQIDTFLDGTSTAERDQLKRTITDAMTVLKDKLAQYKKKSSIEPGAGVAN